MKLTVLGSGTNAPVTNRGAAGYLFNVGKNQLLIDCGPGNFYKLIRRGIKIESINNVLITHCHWDHICDLVTILFAKLYEKTRKTQINIYGPVGIKRRIETLFGLNMLGPPTYRIKIKELKESEFRISGVTIASFPVQHSKMLNSIGYRLMSKGKSIVFTGDMHFTRKNLNTLANYAKNVDLLVIECAYGENDPLGKHLIPSQVARILDATMPKKAVLTHLYPSAIYSDIVGDVKIYVKRFRGTVTKARDYLEVEV